MENEKERKRVNIKTKKKTIITHAVLLILLGFGIFYNQDFFKEVLSQIGNMALWAFLGTCFLGCLYRVLDGVYLYILGKRYSESLTLGKSISIAFCGAFFRVSTLGSGMAVSKIFYLNKEKVPVGNGMGITLLQFIFIRLATLFTGLFCFFTCLPVKNAFASRQKFVILAIVGCIVIDVILFMAALCSGITTFLFDKVLHLVSGHEKLRGLVEKARKQVSLLQKEAKVAVKDKKLFIQLLVISILTQAVWYVIPCLVACPKGILFWPVFSAMALTCLLAGVIPAPSGFGSVEVLFSMMFSKFGPASLAACCVVIYRFASTFAPFFVGLIPVFHYRGGKKIEGTA